MKEINEKTAGFGILAVMILSLAAIMYTGINSNSILSLIIFSVAFSAAVLFFGDWMEGESD